MVTHTAYQYTKPGRLSGTIEKAIVETPTPGDEDIVIKVKAAALNPVDEQLAQSSPRLLQFLGAPVPSEQTPWTPASDFAGTVHAAGKLSGWVLGEEVYGMKPFGPIDGKGTLQEYIVLHKSAPIVRKPTSLSFTDAAALPLVYMTAYDALINYGKLPFNPPTEDIGKRSVLILGGSSGTGSVAIQLAKKIGLHVVTSCSGKNAGFVKSLGADQVINYQTENVVQKALASTLAPYAVVLDCVGGKDFFGSLDKLILDDPAYPELGIYVTIVGDKTGRDAMGGAITNYYYPAQALRTVRGQLQDYLPTWLPLRSWIAGKRYACIMLSPSPQILETIPEFLKSAEKVIIDSVWSFDDARQAYGKLESSRAVGKVVVQV